MTMIAAAGNNAQAGEFVIRVVAAINRAALAVLLCTEAQPRHHIEIASQPLARQVNRNQAGAASRKSVLVVATMTAAPGARNPWA